MSEPESSSSQSVDTEEIRDFEMSCREMAASNPPNLRRAISRDRKMGQFAVVQECLIAIVHGRIDVVKAAVDGMWTTKSSKSPYFESDGFQTLLFSWPKASSATLSFRENYSVRSF